MDLVHRQKDFFRSQKTRKIGFRKEKLKQLSVLIKAHQQNIVRALAADLGKSEMESLQSEIFPILNQISLMRKNLQSWAKRKYVGGSSFFPFSRAYTQCEPYGVSLCITPFNYPFAAALSPLVTSVAAGNCTILSPANRCEKTLEVLAGIVSECFDEGHVGLFKGDHRQKQRLLEDQVDYVFFMGSRKVGQKIASAIAPYTIPHALHLSGKTPVIVHDQSNLDRAAKRIAWAKFLNAGQSCVAPDYCLVESSRLGEFTEALKRHIRAFFGNHPEKSPAYGRLVAKEEAERLKGLLVDVDVLEGGDVDVESRYVAPTIVANVPMNSPLCVEETFGPVLPIFSYSSLEEAFELIEKMDRYPLAVYLFSDDAKILEQVLNRTQTGQVCFNDAMVQPSAKNSSLGGCGKSGYGRMNGRSGFESFSNSRFIFKQPIFFDVMGRFPPYSRFSLKLFKALIR